MILTNSAELTCPHCDYPQGCQAGEHTRCSDSGVPTLETCVCCRQAFVIIRQDEYRVEVTVDDGY